MLLADAAPPPIARVTEAGCASTLAFELSDGDERIVVNCGGAALTGATIPAELARGLRTTAAHSTLVVADSNSTAILPNGTLGRGVTEVELARRAGAHEKSRAARPREEGRRTADPGPILGQPAHKSTLRMLVEVVERPRRARAGVGDDP